MALDMGQLIAGNPNLAQGAQPQVPLPIEPQYRTPPPASVAPQRESFGQQIRGLLQDPVTGGAILRTGLGLMQPRAPGQTAAGHIAKSILGGADYAVQRGDVRTRQSQAERRTKTAEDRTSIASRNSAERKRANQAREAIQQEQVDALDAYRRQMTQNAKTSAERQNINATFDQAMAIAGEQPKQEDFFGDDNAYQQALRNWQNRYLYALESAAQLRGTEYILSGIGGQQEVPMLPEVDLPPPAPPAQLEPKAPVYRKDLPIPAGQGMELLKPGIYGTPPAPPPPTPEALPVLPKQGIPLPARYGGTMKF